MRLDDTIVAAAARGVPGGRTMIRLSGLDAIAVVHPMLATAPSRTRHIGVQRLVLSGAHLPCVCAYFPAPASYTGEDVVELQLPTNATLVERVLAQLTQHDGVRLAGPGEFTARAFLHDKLDAEQAEGVAAMIAARTANEHAAARDLLDGCTGAHYRTLLDEAIELLALVEAGIDFSDQEVVAISPQNLSLRLEVLISTLDALLIGTSGREAPSERLRAVLVGPPNAGKSTLFNALLGRERAVVSDVAGTTRDALVEPLPLDGLASGWFDVGIDLVDLAGLGDASSALDRAAQQLAREHVVRASIVIQCDPAGQFDQHLPIVRDETVTLRVRTKADLPNDSGAEPMMAVCALDGWHLEALRKAIVDAAATASGIISPDGVPLPARHARALAAAREALNCALLSTPGQGENMLHMQDAAITAHWLRNAVDALGEIAGRISPDDVLGRIFATFCIGK